mgnify:CR=1 FL=1
MVIDPLKVHPKEAAKDYSLVKALVKYLEQERIALHRIAEAMGRMPPLQRESDAAGMIEKILASRQKKLIEAQRHLQPLVKQARRRANAAGMTKSGRKRTGAELKEQRTGVKFGSATCVDCEKVLKRGNRVATCNHCNIKFHTACISPMFLCGQCNADLSQFQAIY